MAPASASDIQADIKRVQQAVFQQLSAIFGSSQIAQHQLCKEAARTLFALSERKAAAFHPGTPGLQAGYVADHMLYQHMGMSGSAADVNGLQLDMDQCISDLAVLGTGTVQQLCSMLLALYGTLWGLQGSKSETGSSGGDNFEATADPTALSKSLPQHSWYLPDSSDAPTRYQQELEATNTGLVPDSGPSEALGTQPGADGSIYADSGDSPSDAASTSSGVQYLPHQLAAAEATTDHHLRELRGLAGDSSPPDTATCRCASLPPLGSFQTTEFCLP